MPWCRRSLATAMLGALALGVGCKDPKCWGGGSAAEGPDCTGGNDYSGPDYDPDSAVRNDERQLAEYQPRCDAGEAVACWMVGQAQLDLKRPDAEAEASFATACRQGLGVIPGTDRGVCGWAGELALRPGGAGAAAARDFYQLGCERGAYLDCRELMKLWPTAPLRVAVTACRYGGGEACARAATLATASGDAALVQAATRRGCLTGVDALCAALGRAEVAP
jgi:hypothetical protein